MFNKASHNFVNWWIYNDTFAPSHEISVSEYFKGKIIQELISSYTLFNAITFVVLFSCEVKLFWFLNVDVALSARIPKNNLCFLRFMCICQGYFDTVLFCYVVRDPHITEICTIQNPLGNNNNMFCKIPYVQ